MMKKVVGNSEALGGISLDLDRELFKSKQETSEALSRYDQDIAEYIRAYNYLYNICSVIPTGTDLEIDEKNKAIQLEEVQKNLNKIRKRNFSSTTERLFLEQIVSALEKGQSTLKIQQLLLEFRDFLKTYHEDCTESSEYNDSPGDEPNHDGLEPDEVEEGTDLDEIPPFLEGKEVPIYKSARDKANRRFSSPILDFRIQLGNLDFLRDQVRTMLPKEFSSLLYKAGISVIAFFALLGFVTGQGVEFINVAYLGEQVIGFSILESFIVAAVTIVISKIIADFYFKDRMIENMRKNQPVARGLPFVKLFLVLAIATSLLAGIANFSRLQLKDLRFMDEEILNKELQDLFNSTVILDESLDLNGEDDVHNDHEKKKKTMKSIRDFSVLVFQATIGLLGILGSAYSYAFLIISITVISAKKRLKRAERAMLSSRRSVEQKLNAFEQMRVSALDIESYENVISYNRSIFGVKLNK